MSGMIYLQSNHESCLRGPDTPRAATTSACFHGRPEPALGDLFNGCCSMGEAAKRREAAAAPAAPALQAGSPAERSGDSASSPDSEASSPEEADTNTPDNTTAAAGGGRATSPPSAQESEARSPGPADSQLLGLMDVSLSSRSCFEGSRRQSAPEQLAERLDSPAAPAPGSERGAKPKKLGIADYISRSFFTKKTKEPIPSALSAPGWKLFGKIPPRENSQKDSKTIQQEYEARTGRMTKTPLQSARRRNLEFEPLSTTALILEDRPAHLPAKSAEEAQRHRQEYDEMVAEAKKRGAPVNHLIILQSKM